MKKAICGLLTICIVFFFVTVSPYAATDPLPSWNDGPSKQAVIGFVVAVTTPGSPDFMAKEERIYGTISPMSGLAIKAVVSVQTSPTASLLP